jgi:hypothetical protein
MLIEYRMQVRHSLAQILMVNILAFEYLRDTRMIEQIIILNDT